MKKKSILDELISDFYVHLKKKNWTALLKTGEQIVELPVGQDTTRYGTCFDFYCHTMMTQADDACVIGEIRNLCLNNIKLNGRRAWNILYLGACEFSEYNDEESALLFQEASRLGMDFSHRGYGSRTSFIDKYVESLIDVSYKKELEKKRLKIRFDPEYNASDSDLVIIVACDPIYFEAFTPNMVRSLEPFHEHIILHVHVINPVKQSNICLQSIRSSSLRINYSEEYTDLSRLTGVFKKAYYTIGRYIWAPYLLDRLLRN